MNRSKGFFAFLLIAVLLLSIFAGCKKVEGSSSAGFLPAFSPYFVNHIAAADEFGVARYNQGRDGSLAYGVYYPEANQPLVDDIVTNTVTGLIDTYKGQGAQAAGAMELHINYVSTKINDSIASIRFFGFLKTGDGESAVQTPITKGLLLNLQTNAVLPSVQVLNSENGEQALQEALAAKLKEQQGEDVATDGLSATTIFDCALLNGSGATFVFPANTISAAQTEEISLSLAYDDFSRSFTEDFASLLGIEIASGLHNPNIDPNKPMIALTFDDGPARAVTPKLLNLLDQYGGQATFFVVGDRLDNHKDILQDTANRGHEIACHTWAHKFLTKQSKEDAIQAMKSTNDKVYEYTGQRVTMIRPPGGFYNDATKAQCAELGLSIIMWGIDTQDWKYREADSVFQKAINGGLKDGAIILCHDLYESTYQGMVKLIPYLVDHGYQLVTVSDLIKYKGVPSGNGEVYNKIEAPVESPAPSPSASN